MAQDDETTSTSAGGNNPGRRGRRGQGDRSENTLPEGIVARADGQPPVEVGPVDVSLQRSRIRPTPDQALWVVIRNTTNAISFNRYNEVIDNVMCLETGTPGSDQDFDRLLSRRSLPFNDVEAYRLLKVATEAFLMVNCGAVIPPQDIEGLSDLVGDDLESFQIPRTFDSVEESLRYYRDINEDFFADQFNRYVKQKPINGGAARTFPYLALIREKLGDIRLVRPLHEDSTIEAFGRKCLGILRTKLLSPCLLELIWSYWNEEAMLVQTLNAISMRFQNRHGPGARDPLANLEIDPLRPLNNLLWGYLQDEQHRLTVQRRAYEYDHHYGLSLYGKAIQGMRTVDSRSKFLEGFHHLLHVTSIFFKEDDDTTVIADGFPLLNALREVHLVISEGAHNQFGDLPSTARQEMLIQQWLLARPEMREFLPTRIMVAYPEPWMDRVDAMKKLQGWTDTSVLHFRYLAVFGEQILLSIRFGAWSDEKAIHPEEAANWARYWRPEIQGYVHAYRAVTGVDLTSDTVDYTKPSVHLRNRLAAMERPSR